MIHGTRRIRALVALATVAILATLSVGVPLLDAGRDLSGVTVAGEAPPTGWPGHHHGVCLLYGATAWSPAPASAPLAPARTREVAMPEDATLLADLVPLSTYHSRAPPVA